MAKRLILVLGGARSGKSRVAEELAGRLGPRVVYLATAEPRDPEMAARIAHHRRRRPASWHTVEAPLRVGEALAREGAQADVALLDCLTLLASNLLAPLGDDPDAAEAEARLEGEIDSLLAAYQAGTASLIIVSNEVGWGLVPSSPLGRVFRDVLGRAHQRLAARADRVLLVVAGLAVDLKRLQESLDDLCRDA